MSNRVRNNVNYTVLAAGTGDLVSNLDNNEASSGAKNGRNSGVSKKIPGLKVNNDVYKKCLEFFKKLRES